LRSRQEQQQVFSTRSGQPLGYAKDENTIRSSWALDDNLSIDCRVGLREINQKERWAGEECHVIA
jgi:hypothetical protein